MLFFCVLLCGLLVWNHEANAQSLATKIERALDEADLSGSVIITRAGSTLVSTGRGMANLELHVPNTPTTRFRIGSITKQFTSMAILILQERGLLNVEDTVGKLVSGVPDSWQS